MLLAFAVASWLRWIADPDDTVARLGGDEFAVLMPRADQAHALEFAHRCAIVLLERFNIERLTLLTDGSHLRPDVAASTIDCRETYRSAS